MQQQGQQQQQQGQQQQEEQGGFGPLPLLGAQPSDLMARTSLTGSFDCATMAASYAAGSGIQHTNGYANTNTSSVRMVGGSYGGSDGCGVREVNAAKLGVQVAASHEEASILDSLDEDALLRDVVLPESGAALVNELEATLGATSEGEVAAAWQASAGQAGVDTQVGRAAWFWGCRCCLLRKQECMMRCSACTFRSANMVMKKCWNNQVLVHMQAPATVGIYSIQHCVPIPSAILPATATSLMTC